MSQEQEMGQCVSLLMLQDSPESCSLHTHALKHIIYSYTHPHTHAQTQPYAYFYSNKHSSHTFKSLRICIHRTCILHKHTCTHTLHVIFLLSIMGVPALNIKVETSAFIWCWNKVAEINSACHNPSTHTETHTHDHSTHKKWMFLCVHVVLMWRSRGWPQATS